MTTTTLMRRQGRNTATVATAPPAALLFVHTTAAIGYTKHLARQLGRTDLLVCSLEQLSTALIGRYQPACIDPAAAEHATRQQLAEIDLHNKRLAGRSPGLQPRAPTVPADTLSGWTQLQQYAQCVPPDGFELFESAGMLALRHRDQIAYTTRPTANTLQHFQNQIWPILLRALARQARNTKAK